MSELQLPIRKIYGFFYSQYFSDGLRITLGILIPSLLLNHFDQLAAGISVALGALCVSVVDLPGPILHKRNSMIICCLLIFLVSMVTGYVVQNTFLLGVEVIVFAFFFSMFAVYGTRASAIGTCSLLIMIFMIEKRLEPSEVLPSGLLILAGGVWYSLFSLLFFQIRPYRAAQQALGECITEVAKYLRLKADFYAEKTNIDENYKSLISQQIAVSQHQDAVRELLFKTRSIVKESTHTSRILILTFVDLVDLFDQITYTHHDYANLRETYRQSGVLEEISVLIHQMADELEQVGFDVQSQKKHFRKINYLPELERLKTHIDQISVADQGKNSLFLKKILVNIRNISQRLVDMGSYTQNAPKTFATKTSHLEFSRFVTHQDYAPRLFLENLSFKSASFKHALRVAIVCGIGFILAKTVATGHHSYWILLTIIVILKPGFSLTKQRNSQRLTGTVIGGLIGFLILFLIPDKTVQFFIMLLLMLFTYSFLRLNYVISVIFMTPYVLIVFSFLGVDFVHTVEERLLDTFIGSALAFSSVFIIFPNWESEQLNQSMGKVIAGNQNYLKIIVERLEGKTMNMVEYKLARKDVYVESGNLSASFERMISEPKSRQKHRQEIHRFIVLNHMLSSAIAAIAANLPDKNSISLLAQLKTASHAQLVLKESIKKLGPSTAAIADKTPSAETVADQFMADEKQVDVVFLEDQLRFILKISKDIAKTTDLILS
ncbi:FUSC family membrane protein [Mucilaginibacter sp.]|uniref:FUSC family protein n=1 Tax=Mucilaginibacter sp. TaxID=1882438 RepID=UPI003B008532